MSGMARLRARFRRHPETWREERLRRFCALCAAVEEAGRQELAFIEEMRQERAALAPGQLPRCYFPADAERGSRA